MRRLHTAIPLGAFLLLACGEEDDPELATVAAEPTDEAFDEGYDDEEYEPPAPSHDGTVLMAGDYPVEVVPHEDGEVHAYLLDTPDVEPQDLSLTVEVPTSEGGDPRPMLLVYNPSAGRWEGRLNGPRIVQGPIDVVVEEDGEPYFGHAPEVQVAGPVVVVEGAPRAPVVEVFAPGHVRPSIRLRGGPGRGHAFRHGRHRGHLRGGRRGFGRRHGGRRGGRGHFGRRGGRRRH